MRTLRGAIIFSLACVVSLELPAAAAERTLHWFGAVDYLSPGNQSKHVQSSLDASCKAIIAQGIPCTSSKTFYQSVGARAGALYPMAGLEVGGSLGYLYGGPQGLGKFSFTTKPAGYLGQRVVSQTYRVLAEAKKSFALSGDWVFDAGAGLGLAINTERDTCTESGILSGTCVTIQDPKTLGWGNWELSPAVGYKQARVGLRYSGFARGGQLPWNTFGVFAGAQF